MKKKILAYVSPMRCLHFCLFVSFVIVGCDLTSEKSKETIDEPHEIITIKDDDGVRIQLSEIFDTIKFIPLRNNKNGAVTVDKIIFDKDRIYILDKNITEGVFIYTEKGEFIKRVGSIGRGPGEYQGISDFDFNDYKVLVSSHPSTLSTYTEDGDFIDKKTTDFPFSSFISTMGGYLFYNDYISGSEENRLFAVIKTNEKLEFEQGYLPFDKKLLGSNTMNYVSHFVRTDEDILFSQAFTNTIYSYKNDQFKVKVKFSFEKPVPESYTNEFVSGSDFLDHFTSGYSHLYSLFSSSQDYGFYNISSNGSKYVLKSPFKTTVINKYEDDLFGIPLYHFKGIHQNQLVGTVNFESILLRLNNPNSKSNPLLKAKLLDFMDKYQLDAEVGDPVIAVFKFK